MLEREKYKIETLGKFRRTKVDSLNAEICEEIANLFKSLAFSYTFWALLDRQNFCNGYLGILRCSCISAKLSPTYLYTCLYPALTTFVATLALTWPTF